MIGGPSGKGLRDTLVGDLGWRHCDNGKVGSLRERH